MGMRASDIDKYSRVIFPITFATFHMTYWSIYLTISGELSSRELILFIQIGPSQQWGTFKYYSNWMI